MNARKLFGLIILCILFLSASNICAAESTEDYKVEITTNSWTTNTSIGGSTLYVPYIKVSITNNKTEVATKIKIQVVFYDDTERSIWSDETASVVSSSDDPLKPGYSKTAYIMSSVGYPSKPSESNLPVVIAEIYVNGMLYGRVGIDRTFTEKEGSYILSGNYNPGDDEAVVFDNNDSFGAVVTASYWGTNTGLTGQTLYVPYIKLKVTNQEDEPAKKISVKAVFLSEADQSVFGDASTTLVSSSDIPLKKGYNKTAYLRSNVGYKSQISTASLPTIVAEIYINDEYYGKVNINSTYSAEALDIHLSKIDTDALDSEVKVNAENPYEVTVVANCWTLEKGFGGSSLYVPYIKLSVLNQSGESVDKMKVKVVFYDVNELEVWSDYSTSLVSSSDPPLRHGYRKTAFVKGSVGYRKQIAEANLPTLTAEVYIDDKLIGETRINNTYTETAISEKLDAKANISFERMDAEDKDPFLVAITANCWAENSGASTIYSPYLKIKVINQQGKPADKATVKVVFYDISEKTLWSDEKDYLISSSDAPVKDGYGKTAFIKSSVGYRSKISEKQLPMITAEIYVNDELYGEVEINNTYDESSIMSILEKPMPKPEENKTEEGETAGEKYSIEYLSNCWTDSQGLNGKTLYVPYLKISVTNNMKTSADHITVHVVYTNETDKSVWSDEKTTLVSSSDTALKSGYNKMAFIKSSVGYTSKPSMSQLPSITAAIYINDELFDTVEINRVFGN